MPSTNTHPEINQTSISALNARNRNNLEYEVIIFPQENGDHNENNISGEKINVSHLQQKNSQLQNCKTKHINCNGQNTLGQMYWIPDGYRPVLVRTADLPLLVGAEFPSPSSSDDGN
ncbi:hypothetical protein G9A89_002318 [Geosiphon pyriformis]|nr:hypothetical protein G9A89_002318 [Geosiphon pyriformis]